MAAWNEGWDAPVLSYGNPWSLLLSSAVVLGMNEALGVFWSTQQKKAPSNVSIESVYKLLYTQMGEVLREPLMELWFSVRV